MTILDDAREGMDLDIRPQDDLFGHVNGAWLETTEIPADRGSWGPFVTLAEVAAEQVRAIIEAAAAGELDSDDEQEAAKIGDLYSCFMDEDRIETQGARPIEPVLAAIAALRDKRDLAAFLGEFERVGGSGLFGSYVDTDARKSDRYLVHVLQGGIGLPDESYYRDDKYADIRAAYLTYIARMFELVGHTDAATAAQRVIDLETRIAKGHWERAETRDVQKTYNLVSYDQLQEMLPSFDFGAYLTNLGGDESTMAEVVVGQPSFLDHLESVLAEVDIEDWKALLSAKVIRTAAAYLSADFVETNFDFYGRTLSGIEEIRPRWKRGVSLVEGALGEAVGREYVARHFPPEAKAQMDELVANLLAAYRQSISELDWMSEETKQRAYAKLDTFMPKIGYPVKFRDYSKLTISRDNLLGNVAAVSAFETDRELGKLGGPVDRDEWHMLPQTVNAYYNPGINEICFPAGILQKPFFSEDGTKAENYGGIGAVIGHEIGHGFDDQGAQYDGEGNLNDWWTAEDKAAFEKKSKALIEQYDAFEPRELPGEHVNGALTVGENIGDLGGITIAHRAYKLALEEGEEFDEESFFFNFAHVWRSKRRKELDLQYLATDPHSPPEFRANIVRNLDEFHEAFKTQPGDGLWLDPDQRVHIW